jgi:arylsulfatase A-like enzyme
MGDAPNGGVTSAMRPLVKYFPTSILPSNFEFGAFAFFLLCICSCNTPGEPDLLNAREGAGNLNVLLIVADDMNCDIGAYAEHGALTPNLDRLAEMSTVFDNAHVQYPHCGPSRASLMTSLYPSQTKITQNNVFIRNTIPDVITLGQRFRQQGYESIRIGKIFHYDNPGAIGTAGTDDNDSWDRTINPYGRDKVEEFKINTLKPRKYGGVLSWLAADGSDEEQTDGVGATEAIEQLERLAGTEDNFFLAVGFFRPHTPFVAPKKYFDWYNQDSIQIPDRSDESLHAIPSQAARSLRTKQNAGLTDDATAREIKEAYYSTISFVDAQVGRVLDKLEATGLNENTIVVFVSDHGYHLGEHGHWQKQTLFENATRIPLMISIPGSEGVHRSHSPVELLDLYPTLMDYTEIDPPIHVVGKSLRPIISGQKASVREGAITQYRSGISLRTNRYRITKWGEDATADFELYDHRNDSQELHNLARDSGFSWVLDSLRVALELRAIELENIPEGLGRQFEDVRPMFRSPNITRGDLYDEGWQLNISKSME